MRPLPSRLTVLAPPLVALALAACASPTPSPPAAGVAPTAPSASSPAPGAAAERAAYPAADDPEVHVRAAWCAVTGAQFPIWLAKESGIFARHRLDVDLSFISGSDVSQAAVMRGDVDFLECSGGGVTPGLMATGEMVFVGNFYTGNFFRLMAVPEVQTVADLRGRRFAISRPGDYDNRLAEALLERFNLAPNEDVTLVPIGSQTERYNALKGGLVDATTVNPPVNLAAQNDGFHEVYNLRDLGIAGISVSLYATRQTVESKPRLVERFLAAMSETAAYARSHRERTIQVMSDYLKLTDRQALEGAYDTYATAISVSPVVPLEAVQAVMDEVLKVNPSLPVRDAALRVDNRAARVVEASGFLAAINDAYGPGAPAAGEDRHEGAPPAP